MHEHPKSCCEETPHSFTVSRALTVAAIGGAVITAGIILAPHLLPALGIGGEEMLENTMWPVHGNIASNTLPIGEAGSGLAGVINRAMANYIPGIGEKLAQGGLFNAGVSMAVGLGGGFLGRFIENREDGCHLKWGTIIKYGALITSALIALPTILTGLSMGIMFLSRFSADNEVIDKTVRVIDGALGVSGGRMHNAFLGLGGPAAALPHFITCGASLLPVAVTAKYWRGDHENPSPDYTALDTKGNPLPAADRNHAMTRDEIALTEQYNAAVPAKKILLKKEILEQGYEPDFHADGTVHLYKHGEHHAASVMAR